VKFTRVVAEGWAGILLGSRKNPELEKCLHIAHAKRPTRPLHSLLGGSCKTILNYDFGFCFGKSSQQFFPFGF
jgi:hypothetical protein